MDNKKVFSKLIGSALARAYYSPIPDDGRLKSLMLCFKDGTSLSIYPGAWCALGSPSICIEDGQWEMISAEDDPGTKMQDLAPALKEIDEDTPPLKVKEPLTEKGYKSCPFCGNTEVEWTIIATCGVLGRHQITEVLVECKCGAQGPRGANKEKAIILWNSRITRMEPL